MCSQTKVKNKVSPSDSWDANVQEKQDKSAHSKAASRKQKWEMIVERILNEGLNERIIIIDRKD